MDTQPTINDLIDKIIAGDNTGAQTDFNALVAAKMQDALDAKKIEIAQSVYGSNEVEATSEDESEEEQEVSNEEQPQV